MSSPLLVLLEIQSSRLMPISAAEHELQHPLSQSLHPSSVDYTHLSLQTSFLSLIALSKAPKQTGNSDDQKSEQANCRSSPVSPFFQVQCPRLILRSVADIPLWLLTTLLIPIPSEQTKKILVEHPAFLSPVNLFSTPSAHHHF